MSIPAQPARPQPAGRVARALVRSVHRLCGSGMPYRLGQVVVGDDPFNGRREGRIEAIRAPFVGLRIPGTPAGTLVYFDHRNVRRTE